MSLNNKFTRIELTLLTRLRTASEHEQAVISALIKSYRDGDIPAQCWLSLFDSNVVNRIITAIPENTPPDIIKIILRSEHIWKQN